MEHTLENNSDLLVNIVNYDAKTGVFHPYIFTPELVNTVSPIAWCHSQAEGMHDTLLSLINQLLSDTYSSGWV